MQTSSEGPPQNIIEVTVVYVPASRSKTFPIDKNATLTQMFDKAYLELGEQKRPGDQYFCKNGNSLSSDLSRTVESVVRSVCKEPNFEIRGPTGGALVIRTL
jgi:hypothetical protein